MSTNATSLSETAKAPPTSSNLASDLKPPGDAAAKVKGEQPCCVCKDEKATRDECMLFSSAPDPQQECASTVERYRSCMRGFGFDIA